MDHVRETLILRKIIKSKLEIVIFHENHFILHILLCTKINHLFVFQDLIIANIQFCATAQGSCQWLSRDWQCKNSVKLETELQGGGEANTKDKKHPQTAWGSEGWSEQYCYDNFSPADASAPPSHSALLFSPPAQPAASGSPGPLTLTCRSDVLIISLIWFLVWKTAWPSLRVTYWAWSSWSWLLALVSSSGVSFCLSCSISACRATNCCSRACETNTASDESSN